jgi:hypothetical protein
MPNFYTGWHKFQKKPLGAKPLLPLKQDEIPSYNWHYFFDVFGILK